MASSIHPGSSPHETGEHASPPEPPEESQTDFHGLIQHSFALRVPEEMRPQYARSDIADPRELLGALLEVPAGGKGNQRFALMPAADMGKALPVDHGLLVKQGLATVSPQPLAFVESHGGTYTYPLPLPLQWTGEGKPPSLLDPVSAWDGFISAEEDSHGEALANDFLLVDEARSGSPPAAEHPEAVSWLLCQLLAHRRSRLFGPSLGRRIFNVLLPHALMLPTDSRTTGESWIVQPTLSLFLAEKECGFRSIFSLTLFVIPVLALAGRDGLAQTIEQVCSDPTVDTRLMSKDEIYQTVQAGWSLATVRPAGTRPRFNVCGPMCDYLSRLEALAPRHLRATPVGQPVSMKNRVVWDPCTLDQVTEAIFFTTALRMVEGPADSADIRVRRDLGERVLTSLSASRTSSVVVVDDRFEKTQLSRSKNHWSFPGSLESLMRTIAQPLHVEPRRKYRLDRAFFDGVGHAIGVLPANSCVVVTTDPAAQSSYQESALLQAGWIAYMVIGAATATGMMRSLFHDIEQLNRSSPKAIADVEHEVVVDLHEIYDLDITWDQYRHRYRLLRDALGITRDYKALQSKLQALSRETNTRFEDRSDTRLTWLTAAIVFLTLATVIVTVLVK